MDTFISMNKFISILIILIVGHYAAAQTKLKVFTPINEFTPDLSKKSESELKRQHFLLSKKVLTESEKIEVDSLMQKYGEVVGSVWDVIDDGCSWYCAGGNYKIYASSELSSNGQNNYSAKSGNDLNYKTAWVEGEKDAGIGEYIEYSFKNNSPRITSIIISNGYMKSDLTWKNNNRVKSIKLHINGEEFGILNLSDTKTDQVFKLGTLGHNKDGSDLVLRFEIVEVYKGKKYNDTAITEIYFDGIDVH